MTASLNSGFNLDLNAIEQRLKMDLNGQAHVGFASDFNAVRAQGVQMPTLFVLALDEDYKAADEVTGETTLKLNELFAVMIVLPVMVGNANSDLQIKTLRGLVRQSLTGVVPAGWSPILPHRGRLVELNRDTNNLIYQAQFMTERLIDVTTRPL